LERFEGHNGVRTTGIEEKSVVANFQHGSFFQEGADDGHWADGHVLPPRSEANGRPKVADSICLGEGRWH
jgi:16S rRNA U516 pseudouridylate synthase RsuA-like enzyme